MAKKKKAKKNGGRKSGAMRGIGGAVVRNTVNTAIGVGGYYAQKFAQSKVDWLNENWWGMGAATFALAAVVGTSRKPIARQISSALGATAGYSLAMAYDLNQAGTETGAVFEPHRLTQVVERVVEVPAEPAQLPEAAAVYPDSGPFNAYATRGPNPSVMSL